MKKTEEVILELLFELTQNKDITTTQPILDEGVIDSLTTIELITRLEEQFNIVIDTDELNHHNFNSVENIAALIDQKTTK